MRQSELSALPSGWVIEKLFQIKVSVWVKNEN
jgi:hypothetical protein